MQINLVSQSKKEELQKKRTTSLIVFIAGLLIAIMAGIVFVLFSINMLKRNTIRNLDKNAKDTEERIADDYSDLDKNVTILVSHLKLVKKTLNDRANWNSFFTEVVSLVPDGIWIEDYSVSGAEIVLKSNAPTVSKIAEFINSLEDHEIKIGEEDSEEGSTEKFFKDVDITSFSRDSNNSYYSFEITGNFTEGIWKRM